jgi:hypothetical protein
MIGTRSSGSGSGSAITRTTRQKADTSWRNRIFPDWILTGCKNAEDYNFVEVANIRGRRILVSIY